MAFKWSWLRRHPPREASALHPAWRVGQYVTYFFERSDVSWTAFAISIESQTEDGAWILRSDFKTSRGESTTWFRSDPHAKTNDVDPLPVHEELVRGSVAETPEQLLDDPLMQSSFAMNLLLVRRASSAAALLNSPPRAVRYPCGIDHANRFITPGPGYEKHHDLNARVMITGVACLSINDGQNPVIATSFGLSDPNAVAPESFDDFVDLSHCKLVRHDGFSLSYPATCFLRLEGSGRDRETTVDRYIARLGGVACSTLLTVSIWRGPRDQLTAIRDQRCARFTQPSEGPMGRIVPQPARSHSEADQNAFEFRLEHPAIDGLGHGAILLDASGTVLAQVLVNGCVSKNNPRRQPTLRQMGEVFPEIVGSFQFLANDRAE